MDMFVDLILLISIFLNIAKMNKYFVGILNSWIALPTKDTKFNVQPKKMMSQFYTIHHISFIHIFYIVGSSSDPWP